MSKKLIMILLLIGLVAMFWPAPSAQAVCPLPPGYWKFAGMSGNYYAFCYWCPSWRTYDSGRTWVDYGSCCGWQYYLASELGCGGVNAQIKNGANNPKCDKNDVVGDCDGIAVAQFGDPDSPINAKNRKCTVDDGDPTRFGHFDFDCNVEGWQICINYGTDKKGGFLQTEGQPGVGQKPSVASFELLNCTKGNINCKAEVVLTYPGACPKGFEKGSYDFVPYDYLGVVWFSTNGFTWNPDLGGDLGWWLACYERDPETGICLITSLDLDECEQRDCSMDATAISMDCYDPDIIDPNNLGDQGAFKACVDPDDTNCKGCRNDTRPVPTGLGEVVYNYSKTGVLRPLPYTPADAIKPCSIAKEVGPCPDPEH